MNNHTEFYKVLNENWTMILHGFVNKTILMLNNIPSFIENINIILQLTWRCMHYAELSKLIPMIKRFQIP